MASGQQKSKNIVRFYVKWREYTVSNASFCTSSKVNKTEFIWAMSRLRVLK